MNSRFHTVPRVGMWRLAILVACLAAITVSAQTRSTDPQMQGQGILKVMTYNIYVGTEYAGLLTHNLDDFKTAATQMVLDVRASDPSGRMQAIAREIVVNMPHLVSLQEVSTLSTGPTKDNLTMEFDYLQLLLQALTDQGAPYKVVASEKTWDAIIPMHDGFARATWSVVVLARADLDSADFSFTGSQGGTFTATFIPHLYALDGHPDLCPVALTSTGACKMPWPRGWAYTDVFYRDKSLRIVAAHLDSASEFLEIPQGIELLHGPANASLPVIVAGDLNCDCSTLNDPMYPTCQNFKDAGFLDLWAAANPSDVGYTKHLPVLNQRSDYVMGKGRFKAQAALIVGDKIGDQTSFGLWPSDHASVVVRVQSPGD